MEGFPRKKRMLTCSWYIPIIYYIWHHFCHLLPQFPILQKCIDFDEKIGIVKTAIFSEANKITQRILFLLTLNGIDVSQKTF